MHGDEIVNEFGDYPVSCRPGLFPQVRLLFALGDMEISTAVVGLLAARVRTKVGLDDLKC